MLVNTTNNLTDREINKRQFEERNKLKLKDVERVCVNAYRESANTTLSAAGATCEKAINDLSYSNKNRFCLNTSKEIEALLRSTDITEEILEHSIGVLKRFCDTYAMTRVQSTCARRDLRIMTEFLNEKKKAGNRRCKDAINSLSNENKQKFCANNNGKNSLKVIKRICDAFIDNINAATNYRCIAPYLDTIWYDASEEDLKEIDSNCVKAIDALYGDNKEKFCKDYGKTIPEKGSLLTREGALDDGIRNRAINVVKGACPSFFHSREKREISKVMEEIKMENATNGISGALINTTVPSIGSLPKNFQFEGSNATQGLLASLRNESKACEQDNKGLFIVIGVMAAFVATVSACRLWRGIKDCKKAGSGLEKQPIENQRLLNP